MAYIVQSGEVEIYTTTDDGTAMVLGTVGQGGIFGEMALIDNQPRMASVSALTDTTCVVISEDIFKKKIAEADPFVVGLLRIFVRNIRSLTVHYREDTAAPLDETEAR